MKIYRFRVYYSLLKNIFIFRYKLLYIYSLINCWANCIKSRLLYIIKLAICSNMAIRKHFFLGLLDKI